MKVLFEVSPEERVDIIEHFKALVSQNPVRSPQDLGNVIYTIVSTILESSKDSVVAMTIQCVKETLEQDEYCTSLIEQFASGNIKEPTLLNTEEFDKYDEEFNKALENKSFIIVPKNNYVS